MSDKTASEANKKLRSLYGTWKVMEQLQKDYPGSTIILMATDSPTPFDILVVDPEKSELVAVEVKATTPGSAASRRLSDSQKDFGRAPRVKTLMEGRIEEVCVVRRTRPQLFGKRGPMAKHVRSRASLLSHNLSNKISFPGRLSRKISRVTAVRLPTLIHSARKGVGSEELPSHLMHDPTPRKVL